MTKLLESAARQKRSTPAITKSSPTQSSQCRDPRAMASQPPGRLTAIHAQFPGDLVACPSRLRRRKAALADRTTALLNRRFERNYLWLDARFESQVEPTIALVRTLTIEASADRRQIAAIACARLASGFPHLLTLNLALKDTCKRDKALRKRNHNGIFIDPYLCC